MTPVAALTAVTKAFGGRRALSDVTFDLHEAQIVGLVGPNGAGKTTALRILAGLLRATSGEVSRPSPEAIAYFGGEQTLPGDVSARRWARLWIGGTARRVPSRKFGVLSRGTRQRIGLEVAFGSNATSLLVLDEPWEGLDPDASRWLSDRLIRQRAAGVAVIVSSHRIHDLAAVCDRCEFLAGGRIAGSVECRADAPVDERVASLLDAFDRCRVSLTLAGAVA